MSAPSKTQILSLYRKYLATAQSFSSYNFRTYFLRRSRDLFRSNLLPPSQAATSSPYSKAGSATTSASPPSLTSPAPSEVQSEDATTKLKAFYQTAVRDLEVLKRSALVNRMYEGEKLVVEKPRLIVGGGGAGAEASVGGAGQPTSTDQGSGGAPQSS
ncbi:unnamed protein product [Sympodiomycopsis kandeliae]